MPLPFDELFMQKVERLRVRSHLVNMVLATSKQLANYASGISKVRPPMWGSTKHNPYNHADQPLSVRVGMRLTVNDERLYDEATHTVGDEEKGTPTDSCICEFVREIPGPLFNYHPGFSPSRETSWVTEAPDTTVGQIAPEFLWPKEMLFFSEEAVTPGSV